MKFLIHILLFLPCLRGFAQVPFEISARIVASDTFNDRKGREVIRFWYLSNSQDSMHAVPDTLSCYTWKKSILDVADSLASVFNVPAELVYEVGMNESGWRNIYDFNYVIKHGDLQVIDGTFAILCRKLGIAPVKNRYNYLLCGIYYLRMCYDRYGSWEKARYAYGRGHWKEPQHWTALEKRFMGKIDWAKYDGYRASEMQQNDHEQE